MKSGLKIVIAVGIYCIIISFSPIILSLETTTVNVRSSHKFSAVLKNITRHEDSCLSTINRFVLQENLNTNDYIVRN